MILVMAALLLLLVACGGDSEPTAETSATESDVDTAEVDTEAEPAEAAEESEQATAEPEPTSEPEPTPEPTKAIAEAEEAEAAAEEPAEEVAEETAIEPVAVAVGSSDPGVACFGTSGAGLSCISAEGEWLSYTEDNAQLGSDYITALTTCPDGSLLIAHTGGLNLFDGETWTAYDSDWGYSSADGIACSAESDYWVAHFEGVSHFNNGEWTTYASDQLATGEHATDLMEAIAIAPDGTIWVATASTIAAFDGSEWTRWQPGEGLNDTYFFDTLTIGNNGLPIVGHSDGLLIFDGTGWQESGNNGIYTVTAVAQDPSGNIYVGSFDQGVGVTDGSGWQMLSRETGDLESDRVNTLVADNSGRLWVGTDYGLYIVGADGTQAYRMDNAEVVDHDVTSLVVMDGGPTAPAPINLPTGGLTGYLTENGAPLTDATVELCVESLSSFFDGPTPCSDQPFYVGTTSDTEGTFSFSDLPAGRYIITVETADGWAQLTTSFGLGSERVPVLPGETLDIGELVITAE